MLFFGQLADILTLNNNNNYCPVQTEEIAMKMSVEDDTCVQYNWPQHRSCHALSNGKLHVQVNAAIS